jgi:hypothetical protein
MDDEVETLGWVETRLHCGIEMECEVWLRAHPPAMARKQTVPFLEHHIIEGTEHKISNSRGTHVMVHASGTPFSVGPLIMCRYIPEARFTGKSYYIGSYHRSPDPDTTPWQRNEDVQNGQKVITYSRRTLSQNFEIEVIYTIAAETRRVISKVEREYELETHQVVSQTVEDRYTESPPPDGMFEIHSTEPKTRTDMDAYRAQHSPPVTDEAAISSIGTVIDAAETAWRLGLWDDFAAIWDFTAYTRLPDEAAWKETFEKHAGNWTGWKSTDRDIKNTQRINVPISSNSFTMMPVHGNVVEVRAHLHCSRDATRSFTGTVCYYLQEIPDGYRIVYAQIPTDEIAIKTGRLD